MKNYENITQEEIEKLSNDELTEYESFNDARKKAYEIENDPLYLRHEEQDALDKIMDEKVISGELVLENGFLNTELWDSTRLEEIQKIISNRNSN